MAMKSGPTYLIAKLLIDDPKKDSGHSRRQRASQMAGERVVALHTPFPDIDTIIEFAYEPTPTTGRIPQQDRDIETAIKQRNGSDQDPQQEEPKDYFTAHAADKKPIIKLYWGTYQRKEILSDGEFEQIASPERVTNTSLSFRSDGELRIESIFNLTRVGYKNAKRFLLEKNPYQGKKNKGVYGGKENQLLKQNPRVLILRTPIDISEFPEIKIISQSIKFPDKTKDIEKPNCTNIDFNRYIYESLLKTYQAHSCILLGQPL